MEKGNDATFRGEKFRDENILDLYCSDRCMAVYIC